MKEKESLHQLLPGEDFFADLNESGFADHSYEEFIENMPDETYQKLLNQLGHREYGYRFALENAIVYDTYKRCTRTHLIQSASNMSWPDSLEDLEKAYLVLRRPLCKRPKLVHPQPLYTFLNRSNASKESNLSKNPNFCFVDYRNSPLLDDLSEELHSVDPNSLVSIDHSYELHLVLKDSLQKIWENVSVKGEQRLRLDRYLSRTIAEQTQKLFSKGIDTILDAILDKDDDHIPRKIRWSDCMRYLCLSEIPKAALDRANERFKKIFPNVIEREYEIRDEHPPSQLLTGKDLYFKQLFREFRNVKDDDIYIPNVDGLSMANALTKLNQYAKRSPRKVFGKCKIAKESFSKILKPPPSAITTTRGTRRDPTESELITIEESIDGTLVVERIKGFIRASMGEALVPIVIRFLVKEQAIGKPACWLKRGKQGIIPMYAVRTFQWKTFIELMRRARYLIRTEDDLERLQPNLLD